MAEQNISPEAVAQKIVFDYRESLNNPELVGYLKQVNKSLQTATKSLDKYQKHFQKLNAGSKKQLGIQKEIAETWTQISTAYKETGGAMKDYTKGLAVTRRETGRLQSQTDGLMRSFKGMLGLLGVGSLGVAAFKKVQDMIGSRLDLAISGGPAMMKMVRSMTGAGIQFSASSNLVSAYQGQSLFARFAGSDAKSISGLLNLQKSLAPVGLERSQNLILAALKDLEPQRLMEVLRLANVDPQLALQRAATGQNIGEVSSALNALQVTQATDDPMLQGAKEMTAAAEKINAAIEKLLAEGFQKSLPVITRIADALSGAADNLPTVAGVAGAGLAAYGASKILPKVALPALGVGTGAGASGLLPSSGVGLAKTLGSVGTFIYGMVSVADSLDASLNNKRASEWNLAGRLGQWINPEVSKNLAYQDQIDANKKFLDERMARYTEADQKRIMAGLPKDDNGTPAATKPLGGFNILHPFRQLEPVFTKAKDAVLDFARAMGDKRVKQLQDQAARMQGLQLSADEAESVTQLARLRYAVARETPLGVVGATNELADLQKTLQDEMDKLQKVLGNIDESTAGGRIEANKVRAQILSLQHESKSNLRDFQQMMLDAVTAQAVNASGAFSKIIITRDQNLAQGLEKGIVKEFDAFTGSTRLDHPSMQPVYPEKILERLGQSSAPIRAFNDVVQGQEKVSQLKSIARMFDRLIAMEEQSVNQAGDSPVVERRMIQTNLGGN